MSREITDEIIVNRWSSTKTRATDRKLEFALSLKRVRQLLNTKKCFYTGLTMTHDPDSPNQLTFDRVDNTIGYTDGNVVACTKRINLAKSNLTIPEIIVIYNNVRKHGDRRRD